MSSPDPALGPIVVGFDGSEPSRSALHWAIERTPPGTVVHVVTSFVPLSGETTESAGQRARSIADLAAGDIGGDPRFDIRIVPGEPMDVLLSASEGAQLLVVGRHGTSGMIHSAMGSVGDACARMATCPVLIVPATGPGIR